MAIKKVHIAFPLMDQPTGGGNQFLKALCEYFRSSNAYVANIQDADILIYNSYDFKSAITSYRLAGQLKLQKGTRLVVVHRVDGPIAVVRGNARSLIVDRSICLFNQKIADATVYQSEWSRKICEGFGIASNQPWSIIPNACSPKLFFPKLTNSSSHKIRIVATSWSANWRKGFDIYRYLDRHLNFDRYEMTFIGNSPIQFSNIKKISPLSSHDLSEALRQYDLYITASADDPCSNSLIEALSCGLPVVARNSGGHPELVGKGGLLFNDQRDVLSTIDVCANSLEHFRNKIVIPRIEDIGSRYLEFATQVWETRMSQRCNFQRKPIFFHLAGLVGTVVQQRYSARITRKLCAAVPRLREDTFYRVNDAFRQSAGCRLLKNSDETSALLWLEQVTERLPLFLDSLRHPAYPHLYCYSQTGDLHPFPSLAASVFVAKTLFMAGLLEASETEALSSHICSFANSDGSIFDPWVASHSRLSRLKAVMKNRDLTQLSNSPVIRAETRQAFAALRCLNSRPSQVFPYVPSQRAGIEQYVQTLDWSKPWGAGSHISHLIFFMQHHELWFGQKTDWSSREVLEYVSKHYRRSDGAWYADETQVSLQQKVNGAMKMITAFDAAGIDTLSNPEGLIDLCLGAVNNQQACDHFNVICVLHRCQTLTGHRKDEIRNYCLDRLRSYQAHYWPWQGGFSFFASGANGNYYGARVTTGMAEPDIHGTALMIWGITLITELLGWQDKFNLVRPWT